jgi:CHRD domain
MSKRLMRAMAAVALLGLTIGVAFAGAAGSKNEFTAKLNGPTERPKTTSKATGTATFHISSTGKSISYTLNAKGLTGPVVASHIHFGKPGKAGPVIIPICPGACKLPKHGTLTATRFQKDAADKVNTFAQAIAAIRAGNTYVNIHTAKFPAGEIRGQLVRHK